MDLVGVAYQTCPSAIDEKSIRHEDAAVLTRALAEAKARKVAEKYPDAVIVSGDAVAALRGRIFEKPGDLDEAAAFLRELSDNEFQFVTALAVLHAGTQKMLSAVEVSNILFRPLLEREIQNYIRAYPVKNFAGAFEDDAVLKFADRVSGSPNIGTAMPVSRLTLMLREQGWMFRSSFRREWRSYGARSQVSGRCPTCCTDSSFCPRGAPFLAESSGRSVRDTKVHSLPIVLGTC
jgi:MAF protein